MISVGVNETDPGAGEIKRVLQFPAGGVIIVVALRVHDREAGAQSRSCRRIEAAQAGARVAEDVVQLLRRTLSTSRIPTIEIVAVGGGSPEMFAEHHRVVPRLFRVEDGFAQVHVRRPAGWS